MLQCTVNRVGKLVINVGVLVEVNAVVVVFELAFVLD